MIKSKPHWQVELENAFAKVPKHKTPNLLFLAALCIIVLGAGGIHISGDKITLRHDENNIINVNSYGAPLRSWSDIPADQRQAIKVEALLKFPQIKDIGTGIDWKPISKWLAEEKGVIHSNPRDIFRERRK